VRGELDRNYAASEAVGQGGSKNVVATVWNSDEGGGLVEA